MYWAVMLASDQHSSPWHKQLRYILCVTVRPTTSQHSFFCVDICSKNWVLSSTFTITLMNPAAECVRCEILTLRSRDWMDAHSLHSKITALALIGDLCSWLLLREFYIIHPLGYYKILTLLAHNISNSARFGVIFSIFQFTMVKFCKFLVIFSKFEVATKVYLGNSQITKKHHKSCRFTKILVY